MGAKSWYHCTIVSRKADERVIIGGWVVLSMSRDATPTICCIPDENQGNYPEKSTIYEKLNSNRDVKVSLLTTSVRTLCNASAKSILKPNTNA
jgi:hypothetical protein